MFCTGCRALNYTLERCDLGHKVEAEYYDGMPIRFKPCENCEKPLTIKKYVQLMQTK